VLIVSNYICKHFSAVWVCALIPNYSPRRWRIECMCIHPPCTYSACLQRTLFGEAVYLKEDGLDVQTKIDRSMSRCRDQTCASHPDDLQGHCYAGRIADQRPGAPDPAGTGGLDRNGGPASRTGSPDRTSCLDRTGGLTHQTGSPDRMPGIPDQRPGSDRRPGPDQLPGGQDRRSG
jgi:hypothetical protein